MTVIPLLLAGFRVYCTDSAVGIVATRATPWKQAGEGLAFMELGRLFAFDIGRGTVLPGGNIKQARLRAVGRRIPIRPALVSWVDERAFDRRLNTGSRHGTTLGIKARGPICFHEWLSFHELACDAIDHI